MKRQQGRDIDYEMGQLHARQPAPVNGALLRLLNHKEKLIQTGACKLASLIIYQHWNTGKLLAKSHTSASNAKIQFVSSTPSSSVSVNPAQAILIENLAQVIFDRLVEGASTPKATVGSVTFADTLLPLIQVLSKTLRDPVITMESASTMSEESEARREALLEQVKKSVTPLLSRLLSWYGTARPVYGVCLRLLLQQVGSDWEKQLDAAERLFGELSEMPLVGLETAKWPLDSRLKTLADSISSKGTKHSDQVVFDKLFKLAILISKAPSALRPVLWHTQHDILASTLADMMFLPSMSSPTVEVAAETLRFVGTGQKLDFESRFWNHLKTKQPVSHKNALFTFFLGTPRSKEARVAMLNKVLQSFSATSDVVLSANSHDLLVFVLTHPQVCPDVFSSLSAYVQKNSHIQRIQRLVDESAKNVDA